MKILLFSGGIDSTAIAWLEKPDALLFIDYGQLPAPGELRAATAIASAFGLPLEVRRAPLQSFGTGTLAGLPRPTAATPEFWPFRNQMLITLAAMAYADREPLEILIGTVASDAVHPDGRVEFIDGMNKLLGAQGQFTIRAPAISFDTASLLQQAALSVGVLEWTFSCHTGEWACGQCRGCNKHNEIKRRFNAI